MFAKLKSLFRKKPDALAEARTEIALLQYLNMGLERAVATLERTNNENYNRFFRTICMLVAARGGSVTLTKDLMEAIEADTDLQIKYSDAPDGARKIELESVEAQEAEANAAAEAAQDAGLDAEFEDDCNECSCGDCCGNDEDDQEFNAVSQ